MAQSETRYDLYRVYDINKNGGKLRIAEGMHAFAQQLRAFICNFPELPDGIKVAGLSFRVDPEKMENYFCKNSIALSFQNKIYE